MGHGDVDENSWQLYAFWPYYFGKQAVAVLQAPGWSGMALEIKALMLMPAVAAVAGFYWFDANGLAFWRDKNFSNFAFAYGVGAAAAFGSVQLRPEIMKRAITGKW